MDTSDASYTPAAPPGPRFRVLRELLLHAVAATITVGVLFAGLRLDQADPRVPFGYDQDSLLILPMVKETIERASPWTCERLGAPGRQELHDFPVVDHLHFAVIWLMGRVWPDPVVVFNYYHVLTYPLAAATALWVLRRLGLSAAAAVCGAVLFGLQPYHWLRGTAHYFLSAYYMVPLTLWVTLGVCDGRRLTWGGLAIAALTSIAGAYYAFFACLLMAVAGVYGGLVGHGWRALARGLVLVGVIVLGGVLAHAPTWGYKRAHGDNSAVTRRPAEDAEVYALKLAQLLLPVANHNPVGLGPVPLFEPAVVRAMYQAPQYKPMNESDWSPLGLIGACGFVALLVLSVLPVKKPPVIGACAALTLAAVLFCGHGGFGAVFNLLVTSAVRCHNRISIYLAFLALFAACRFVDWLLPRRWKWPVFLILIGFGVWDQTDTSWFPDLRRPDAGYPTVTETREAVARRWWADRRFFTEVEEALPAGGAVFTYPYLPFPEAPPYMEGGSPGKIESYDMVRGYLHTHALRWSFGAMKYRAVDGWMRTVAGAEPVPRMLERLVLAGFDALLVDRKGLNPKKADALRAEIDRVLGQGSRRWFHPDGRLVVYDLRDYRRYLREQGAARLDALAAAERNAVSVLWLGNFASYEPTGYEWRGHWGGPAGELAFVNPTDRARTFTLSCRLRTVFNDEARLTVAGDVWADALTIDGADKGQPYRRTITLPPGESRVRVTCVPAVMVMYTDSRRLLYTVTDFKLTEEK